MATETIRTSGTVIWFSDVKGFGFIATDGEKDAFVHFTDVTGKRKRPMLAKGQEVECVLVRDEKGLRATNVKVIVNPN